MFIILACVILCRRHISCSWFDDICCKMSFYTLATESHTSRWQSKGKIVRGLIFKPFVNKPLTSSSLQLITTCNVSYLYKCNCILFLMVIAIYCSHCASQTCAFIHRYEKQKCETVSAISPLLQNLIILLSCNSVEVRYSKRGLISNDI